MDIHTVCKGAGGSLLRFDKKVFLGNWNSVKIGRSTAWAAEAAERGRSETGM